MLYHCVISFSQHVFREFRLVYKEQKYPSGSRRNVKFLDYADTAHASFADAGSRWAAFAPHIRKLLNCFLCASQITSNAVYALFIAKNIKPVKGTSINDIL